MSPRAISDANSMSVTDATARPFLALSFVISRRAGVESRAGRAASQNTT